MMPPEAANNSKNEYSNVFTLKVFSIATAVLQERDGNIGALLNPPGKSHVLAEASDKEIN